MSQANILRITAFILPLLLFTSLTAHASIAEQLSSFGIIIPREAGHGGKLLVDRLVWVSVTPGERGLRVWASSGSVVSVGVPGGPKLAAIEYLVPLPDGYTARVEVTPVSYHVLDADNLKLEAMPPLYILGSSNPRQVRASIPRLMWREIAYPLILYTSYTVLVNGKRYEKIIVYPIHYIRGKLVVIDSYRLRVWLERQPSSGMNASQPRVLVLARNYALARTVAEMVKEAHPEAVVYAAGLENVTRANVSLPLQKPVRGVLYLPKSALPLPLYYGYNYTLAALVRGYVALMHEKEGINYLLIVGGARDVPPSYYYFSESELYMVDVYNAWIPTDYFYADLDLDFAPDVYVGRIPTSNVSILRMYFEKVIAYQASQKRPTVLVIGGHPFNIAPPVGESMISTYTLRLDAFKGLEPEFMTRTLGNYTREFFRSLFLQEVQPAWILVIAHGLGSLWADYFYNKTTDSIEPVQLLTSQDILKKSVKRERLGVVTSVACINGAWDTDLMPPVFYPPVSIGEAIVESWSGVAYVGHSRVAIEWGLLHAFNITNGTITANFGGAILLHGYLIKAWSEGAETLGEAVWKGALMYLADRLSSGVLDVVSEPQGALQMSQVMVLELELLGDPLLRLPEPHVKPAKGSARLTGSNVTVYAGVLYRPVLVVGSAPVYKPIVADKLVLEGEGIVKASLARVRNLFNELLAFEKVADLEAGKPFKLNASYAGVLLVGVATRRGYLLLTSMAAGVGARYENGTLRIEAWALDKLAASGSPVYIYIDGDLARVTFEPSLDLSVRYSKPGKHLVYAIPAQSFLSDFFLIYVDMVKVLRELSGKVYSASVDVSVEKSLEIRVNSLLYTSSTLRIPIQVLLDGRPVDAKLEVSIGGVKARVYRNATGLYTAIIEGLEPGSYLVRITAKHSEPYLTATGRTALVIVVDESTARVARVLQDRISALNTTLNEGLNRVIDTVNESATLTLRRLNESFSVLSGSIEKASMRIEEDLRSLASGIRGEISMLRENVTREVRSVESRLSEKIDSTSKMLIGNVTNSIGEAKRALLNALDEKASSIKASVDSLSKISARLAADINDVRNRVTAALALAAILIPVVVGSAYAFGRRS